MFENIIGQDDVTASLRQEVLRGELPGSMLFYGPPYSGKTTTALELARVLTCETGKAAWNCSCRSCELHRRLIHPNTLLLGSRYFLQEIAACAEVFLRQDKPSSRYLFIRSVRKLTRRFDPVLWEGSDAKLKKVQSLLAEAEELLEFFIPGVDHPDRKVAEGRTAGLREVCEKILKEVKLEGIPVDRIRKANLWAQTTGSSRKIIILENAEEMLEGARNALLKTLEEPVQDVYFILITSRRHVIIPTILSRLRPYRFVPRDGDTSKTVLERIFREDEGRYETIREYFLAYGVNLDQVRHWVAGFLDAVIDGPASEEDMRAIFNGLKKEGSLRLFLEELTRRIREYDHPGKGPSGTAVVGCRDAWMKDIRETVYRCEALNQSIVLAAENLFYSMREAFSCAAS